jgi:hypothetical protein
MEGKQELPGKTGWAESARAMEPMDRQKIGDAWGVTEKAYVDPNYCSATVLWPAGIPRG